MIENIEFEPAEWTTFWNGSSGFDGQGNIASVYGAQWIGCTAIPPFCPRPGPGSELGGLLGQFRIDISSGSYGTLVIDFMATPDYPEYDGLQVVDWQEVTWDYGTYWVVNGTWQSYDHDAETNYLGTQINVVPAVPSVSLLAFGVLATALRNRKTS